MSDINIDFGNLLDILFGGAALIVALILALCGCWFRRRWLSCAAGVFSCLSGVDLAHSLSYAKRGDVLITCLAMGFAVLLLGFSAWAFFRRRRSGSDSRDRESSKPSA